MSELITTLTDAQYEAIMDLEHRWAVLNTEMKYHRAEVEFERLLLQTEKQHMVNAEYVAWLKLMNCNVLYQQHKMVKARLLFTEALTITKAIAEALTKDVTTLLLTPMLSVAFLKLEGYVMVEDGTGEHFTNQGNVIMRREERPDVTYSLAGTSCNVREPIDWALLVEAGFDIPAVRIAVGETVDIEKGE